MANMIKYIHGNLFNSKAQTIVNTVNCVGVMGKGIALVFKLRYPKMFDLYQDLCRQGLMDVGKLWLYKGEPDKPWVLNFPTKTHWKLPSEYRYLEMGLQKFLDTYKEKGITSIAFPLLGANNGGLDKEKVIKIMTTYLSQCDIPVEIYEYVPQASDDIFKIFREKWNSVAPNLKRKEFGIRTQKQVDTIEYAINHDNIQSLISLVDYPGIGITTLEKCFRLVMDYTDTPSLDLQ